MQERLRAAEAQREGAERAASSARAELEAELAAAQRGAASLREQLDKKAGEVK